LYNPTNGVWSATGSLNTARYGHTATLLPNGMVLVAGGYGAGGFLASAELYNPSTGTWSETESLNVARNGHTATLLPNGQVLVAGGWNDYTPFSSAELYDPITGTWTETGSMNTARNLHTATLLPSGLVLVSGGWNESGFLTSAELYNPAIGTWTASGSLNTEREYHTATLLPNGQVLVAGGWNGVTLSSAELYNDETTAPLILIQPVSQTAIAGSTATFSVTAIGAPPLYYQWQFNGNNLADGGQISGSTTSTLLISGVTLDNLGNYTVLVEDSMGSVSSAPAALSALTITVQPTNQTATINSTVTFIVGVSGNAQVSFQWYFNGAPIQPPQTNSSLTLNNVQMANEGGYSVVISTSAGSLTSDVAHLTLLDTNGLYVDWEMQYFGYLGLNPNGDSGGDGVSNLIESEEGLDPFSLGIQPDTTGTFVALQVY
jgi:hypothetical protein